MPIHLDKILADIAKEKVLHPYYTDATKKDIDDAWARVGKMNKLSVHESRSIFKVLQKKYDQEKHKEQSSWKLFAIMEQIHKKEEPKTETKEEEQTALPMEEEEEYEMLDVNEDDEAIQQGLTSDDEEMNKSINRTTSSPDRENDKSKQLNNKTTPSTNSAITSTSANSSPVDERKLLNALATPRSAAPATPTTAATAAALQKKGITLKKTNAAPIPPGNSNSPRVANTSKSQLGRAPATANTNESCKTIQLPDSIKRKLSDDLPCSPQVKKLHIGHAATTPTNVKNTPPQTVHTTTAQLMQVKQEREEQLEAAASQLQQQQQTEQGAQHAGISLITIPVNATRIELSNGGGAAGVGNVVGGGGGSSSTAATVASTSTNGFSPRIEDIDFKHDIIFDTGSAINGPSANNNTLAKLTSQAGDIINLGNFDNSLPPTFFKNLCNSSRHEALGLYVANIMNRLPKRAAAKLELGILRAIIDVQSDELEDMKI